MCYRKAGVKDFWVYNTNFGGAPTIDTVRPISKYAELDEQGLLGKAGLSQEAIQQLNARRAPLASVVGNDLFRFVPELSFGMPTARSATN